MKKQLFLRAGLEAGGAPVMWERVLRDQLEEMHAYVPSGSLVLEVGYGDGLLSCYLCRELGWQIVGLDVDPDALACAIRYANEHGMTVSIDFRCCELYETRKHEGQYDAVFIKTVLYSSQTLEEYGQWLNWILSVLKPGGVLINFETGRANAFTQWYRRKRGRAYSGFRLYTAEVETLYDARFEILFRRYYGGWSQFFAPIFLLYRIAYRIEEAITPRNADNCFIVSMIGRKRSAEG